MLLNKSLNFFLNTSSSSSGISVGLVCSGDNIHIHHFHMKTGRNYLKYFYFYATATNRRFKIYDFYMKWYWFHSSSFYIQIVFRSGVLKHIILMHTYNHIGVFFIIFFS